MGPTAGGECSVDGCPRQAEHDGLCQGHLKRRQRGQVVNEPLAARPSGVERLTEAALRYAAAEGEEDFRRAKDNLRKAAVAVQTSKVISELTREALAQRKAAGARLGRPPKVTTEQVIQAYLANPNAGTRALAAQFGVCVQTIRIHLARWSRRKKTPVDFPDDGTPSR